MLCTDMTLIKYGPTETTAEPLPCKRWTCEHCRPRRMRAFKALAADGLPDMMITLTSNPAVGESPDDRARKLVDAWRRTRRAAMRRFKLKTLEFLAVFEKTKAGEPHLHILCRSRFIPHEWLSNMMREQIGAPVVDIRRIKGRRQAVNYVSKYVGKQPHQFSGLKRYWRSQKYVKKTREDGQASYKSRDVFDVVFTDFHNFCMLRMMMGEYYPKKDGVAVLLGDRWRYP